MFSAQPAGQEPPFADRRAAGRRLAQDLGAYAGRPEVLVLGLPRGGVPVAYEVALSLGAPLDVLLVRKLGVPGHEELAFGAIASSGVWVLNPEVVAVARLSPGEIEQVTADERRELVRREQVYRAGRPPLELEGRTVLLVDDGLATGATMRAAAQAVREHRGRPVVAVPVAPAETLARLASLADDVICAVTPEEFGSVGLWYQQFAATSDAEVGRLLSRLRLR